LEGGELNEAGDGRGHGLWGRRADVMISRYDDCEVLNETLLGVWESKSEILANEMEDKRVHIVLCEEDVLMNTPIEMKVARKRLIGKASSDDLVYPTSCAFG